MPILFLFFNTFSCNGYHIQSSPFLTLIDLFVEQHVLDELHRGVVDTAHQLQISGDSKLRVHGGIEEHVADGFAGDATREPSGDVKAGLELGDGIKKGKGES